MSEKINCPFCGNIINTDAYKCPSCEALFSEPELPSIKFQTFAPFFVLEILTFGLFGTIWFFINWRGINKLALGKKDTLKLNWLIALLFFNLAAYIFYVGQYSTGFVLSAFVASQIIINILLTHRVLRIIQKFTKIVYNVELETNLFYIIIFNILYLIHFIDTYSNRVTQVHEYFNPKSPQMILLVVILLILQFFACLNTDIHHFYKWLFTF